MMKDTLQKPILLRFRLLAAFLSMCLLFYALPELTLNVEAAQSGTSLSFAEHGLKAYRDGWIYILGNKGQVVNGHRSSDCAGLLYAYFTDNHMATPMGGATSQVEHDCVFSGDLEEGLPRIHGLALTMPDYYDPGTGIYGHIGIYVGNNRATDNSDTAHNMRYETVVGNDRNWNAWHVFDNGLKYPKNGWYSMDGAMYHYTDCQYDVNTRVDGYEIGEDGIARDMAGKPIPVDDAMKNDGYVSAAQVGEILRRQGYDGKDNTAELVGMGSDEPDPDYNGRITGNGVNLREKPTTVSSPIVTTLLRGTKINILEEVKGELIKSGSASSDLWYKVKTFSGKEGFVCSLYAERTGFSDELVAPTITAKDGYVTLSTPTQSGEIYFTVDNTLPDENSIPYTGPNYLVGCTYKAVTVRNGEKSSVTTASVLSDGSIFTDFTSSAWYFDAVDEAVKLGLFEGTGQAAFSPKKTMSRAMLVTTLYRLDGAPQIASAEEGPAFSDVKPGSWYADAVYWAKSLEITDGTGKDAFSPSSPVTREQFVTMLWRYAGSPASEASLSGFADSGRVSSFAKKAMCWAVENKIIEGKEGKRLDPKGAADRAQGAKILVAYSTSLA